ncbi:MAG: hypothetical protein ACOX7Q_07040 [Kiritimatiellia bacterium]
MNSVRHVGDAIAFETARQSAAVQAGETVVQHTRLWDPDKKVTLPMRAKFEGPCVPDPSVPAIELTPAWIESLRARLPEMPAAKAERLVKEHGISAEDAAFLSADTDVADYFEALTAQGVTDQDGPALDRHAGIAGGQGARPRDQCLLRDTGATGRPADLAGA